MQFLVLPAHGQSGAETRTVRNLLNEGKELPYDQTLATSKSITADQRNQLVDRIVAELRPNAKEFGVDSASELRKLALGTRV